MPKKHLLFIILLISLNLSAQQTLIVGTYTKTCKSAGIYVYKIEKDFKKITLQSQSDSVVNASFLSLSKNGKRLHAVSENGKNSQVLAYDFDNATEKLQFLNAQKSAGDNPCHIIEDEKNVIIANYSGGNVVVFSKTASGLSEAKQLVQHTGKSINEKRQEAPHAHGVYFSPNKKHVLVSDLGNDTVTVYNYDKGSNTPLNLYQTTNMDAGSGPRHLVFSKNGLYVFVLNELTSTITTFEFTDGKLIRKSQIDTLPKKFSGKTGSAEILVSPDGKFLYASNRGEVNTISVFQIEKNGLLNKVEEISTLGKGPRNFTIDKTGKFLLVGNQYTNEIVLFHRNKKTGKLTDSKKRIAVCAPVCLVFAKD